jgi:hypothetical protein
MIYTISPDLLRNLSIEEGVYFTDVLFVFAQKNNPYKVSRDANGKVLRIYESINRNALLIKTWLDFMSFAPSKFEIINLDIESLPTEELKFVKLCKETIGQNKIVYYSKQNITEFQVDKSVIFFEERPIMVLDRDEIRCELDCNRSGDIIINSQVSKEGSQMNNSTNK